MAIATSLAAFVLFNLFFLPPVGTLAVADPAHWVSLLSLLAVSLVASHLSAQARRRTHEVEVQRDEIASLLEERREAESIRRNAELKSALLAALGHDLKSPLTAATVAADNLSATWLDEDGRREQAEILRTELVRLNRLFQDIVDMARIETQAVDAEPEWVQPAEMIDAAAAQAADALAGHELRVRSSLEAVLVEVDPRLVSAALAHVLENAGQYSPPGSDIDVDVSLASGELHLTVRDRGVGVAAGEIEHLFDRYYRGAEGKQQRFGTGMGLAITRGLLAAHGGRAWAANHQDGGAVFTIAVPVATRSTSAVERELS